MTSPPKDRQDSGTDPERERFEAWAKPRGWSVVSAHGRYRDDFTRQAFAIWLAALSSSPQGGAAAQEPIGEIRKDDLNVFYGGILPPVGTKLYTSPGEPPAVAAPPVTEAMVTAYLTANDAYWKRTDELPRSPDKWRTGTPREATRVSLAAALASQGAPAEQPPSQEAAHPVGAGVRQDDEVHQVGAVSPPAAALGQGTQKQQP